VGVALLINDLKRHNDAIGSEIRAAIDRVVDRGWYILGPEVEGFEREFAAYCGTARCVATANGTDAIELALRAVGVGPGQRVIAVANAGMYGTTAIRALGAVPCYVDVDPQSMTMDPAALEAAVRGGDAAVIVTHLYGRMADMPRLAAVAARAGVPLIEDCAQAHGAVLAGRPAGSWGAAGCFSFYPTKNLGALGDGGAVVTSDPALAERLLLLRQYGWSAKYHSALPGGRNSRLDEVQAAVLRAKLPYLAGWNEKRRAIARAYHDGLRDTPLQIPAPPGEDDVAHLYVVRTPGRDGLRTALSRAGIGTEIHYPVPDHWQESSMSRHSPPPVLPVTEECSRQVLTLPCFPEMVPSEVEAVIAAVLSGLDAKTT
jgi:dTDP-4-amino-4,6-dideoxygalactose transaminase